jgi:hypothetical protein
MALRLPECSPHDAGHRETAKRGHPSAPTGRTPNPRRTDHVRPQAPLAPNRCMGQPRAPPTRRLRTTGARANAVRPNVSPAAKPCRGRPCACPRAPASGIGDRKRCRDERRSPQARTVPRRRRPLGADIHPPLPAAHPSGVPPTASAPNASPAANPCRGRPRACPRARHPALAAAKRRRADIRPPLPAVLASGVGANGVRPCVPLRATRPRTPPPTAAARPRSRTLG